ncbi:MAG: TonB-dependent receptor [Ginsengibacter sp.]
MRIDCIKSRARFIVLMSSALILFQKTSVAQTKTGSVKGLVENNLGVPVGGASVIIKSKKTNFVSGANTDSSGTFSFSQIPAGGPYIFTISSVGYEDQTLPGYNIKADGALSLEVKMVENVTTLDQVVVIGYGTQKRKDLTGSVSSVSEKDFADMPVANLDEALAGRVPGLDILSDGGRPGDGSNTLLRGQRSFTASNDPLIILDGMPYYGSINDINPYDISSVDVLKDASSTAIYGSRGANGVIIITTKRGKTGAPRIRFETYAGTQLRYGRIPYANGVEYAEWGREAFRAQPGGYPYPDINAHYDSVIFDVIELKTVLAKGEGLDFQDLLFQNGNQQKHQISVNGGNESVKYNFAANYFKQEGLMPDDIFSRMTLRSNLDFTLSKRITAGTSIQLSYTDKSEKSNPSAFNSAINGNPLGQIYEDDGVTPRFALTTDGLELNPLADYVWDSHRGAGKRWGVFINTYVQAKITDHLTYRLNLGENFKLNTQKQSDGYYSLARNLGLPTASIDNRVDNFKIYESTLTYDQTIKSDHHITLTAVQGFQKSRTETSGAGVSDLPYEPSRFQNIGSANLVSSVSSDLSEWSLASYVGRLFYGYKSKYLITLSVRADGASQFSPGHKWGYFPSAAIAYRISQESFMKPTESWLSDLKIRLSYGVTGNQAISPYQTQGSLGRTTYSWNEAAAFGYRPAALSNKNLKWESTEVYNLGLDFALFDNKISGNLELYNTNTYDLLMFRKLPVTSGYDQVLENVGSTNNKGWELGLRTSNISRKNFKWNSNFSVYGNHTKIVTLYNGKIDDIGNGWFIGQPISVYYDYKKIGIWQTDEKTSASSYGRDVGQIKVQDLNNDGKVSADDRMILGNREPDLVFTVTNQFTYKNWDLSFLVNVRWGGMTSVGAFAPYAKKRYNKIIFDYWTPTNPTNDYPRPNQLYEGSGLDGSTLTYRDASMISLRTLSLGYTIPPSLLSRVSIANARVYFSGENLLYWTKSELRKFNMRANWYGDVQTYPAVRTLVLGINIGL